MRSRPICGRVGWMLVSLVFAGNAQAQSEAALNALNQGRYKEAFGLLMPDARAGKAEAQRLIGEMYFKGQSVPANVGQAFIWNRAAADGGDRLAQYSVGYFYENGIGVAASSDQALEYYKKSAIQQFVPAALKVGDLYVSKDQFLAAQWYETAGRLGSEEGLRKFAALRVVAAREENAAAADMKAKLDAEEREAVAHRRREESRRAAEDEADARAFRNAQFQVSAAASGRPPTVANQRVADARLSSGAPRQVDPVAEQKTGRTADVVDANPNERYPSSAYWGSPINGWIDNPKFTEGGTRESACQATLAAMSQRMSKDTSTGLVSITEKTGCYCQSKPRSGMLPNDISAKGWLCTAYYKVKSTGKDGGVVAR